MMMALRTMLSTATTTISNRLMLLPWSTLTSLCCCSHIHRRIIISNISSSAAVDVAVAVASLADNEGTITYACTTAAAAAADR
jgi:hypothetical protein